MDFSRFPENFFVLDGVSMTYPRAYGKPVSVIMPTYNMCSTLDAAIDSVLRQTYSNFELIVVDDASTDCTWGKLTKYMRYDIRIKLVRNPKNSRAGPVEWEPRNDALRIAEGKYIAYLDADNEWRPSFLEKMVTAIERNPGAKLAFCRSCNHYSAAEKQEVIRRDKRPLLEHGSTWTVFSGFQPDRDRMGVEQYVDTNEIVHRSDIFENLLSLWRTWHPRRDYINSQQSIQKRHRRHNDLDLVERVIEVFGTESVIHVEETLVDYFYPSACRKDGACRC